jgi:hypothetical protein|tara:strand:+ start:689 stop:982 length:294 start_codon:yes stop_codon:yes gene_type:complete
MNKKLSKKDASALKALEDQAKVKATIRDMGEFKGDFVISATAKAPRAAGNQDWQEFVDGLTVSEYANLEKSPIENSLSGLRYFVKHGYIVVGPVATN